jgi:hypothetical protein
MVSELNYAMVNNTSYDQDEIPVSEILKYGRKISVGKNLLQERGFICFFVDGGK